VEKQIAPTLEAHVAGVLGQRRQPWFEYLTEPLRFDDILATLADPKKQINT
jgi:hypothetical protein